MPQDTLPEPIFSAVLDELIPARGDALAGAGALGLGEYVAAQLGEAAAGLTPALAALDDRSRERTGEAFADAPAAARRELLAETGEAYPGFLDGLLFHLYSGYYQHPEVMEALGLEARAPFPGGYSLEMGDLGLLDAVGTRGAYRET